MNKQKKYTVPDTETIVNNIDEWLALLRGEKGRIPQTMGVLRKKRSFCCLGVAAQKVMHLKTGGPPDYSGDYTFVFETDTEELEIIANLEYGTHKAMGLYTLEGAPFIGIKLKPSKHPSLVELNDAGRTFKQIEELLSLDLRTGCFGFFTPEIRIAWQTRHGFKLHQSEFALWEAYPDERSDGVTTDLSYVVWDSTVN